VLTAKSSKHPEITVASIIDRLLQLVTVDTYGENSPSEEEQVSDDDKNTYH